MKNELYEKTAKVLGGLINQYRTAKGLSYRQLSSKTGISIALLSDTENGHKIPRFETIIRVINTLDIPMNKVFSANIIPMKETRSTDTLDKILYSKGLTKADVNFINEYIKFKTSLQ